MMTAACNTAQQRQYQTEKHPKHGQAAPFSFDRIVVGAYSCIVHDLDTVRRVPCANVVQPERVPGGKDTTSSSMTMELTVLATTMNTTMNIITVTAKTPRGW
ncbi:MAG: hypothetical protein SWH78_08805 [Thermodesulfobacteriota bacterium]|nr:hypothetical protein [Thermodesulfobacteriota bacterium]